MIRSVLTCFLFFTLSQSSFSQTFEKRFEIRINCDQTETDTISIETYSKTNKVIRREEKYPSSFLTSFVYDEKDRLIRIEKSGAGNNKIFELTKIYYSSADTNRSADTIFGKEGKLQLSRKYEYDNSNHRIKVTGTTPGDLFPPAHEIIQLDEANHELSRSLCYGMQSCITNKSSFINGKISVKEKWSLKPNNSVPVLIQTESYVYDENNLLKAIVINLADGEKENCKERLFYFYQ